MRNPPARKGLSRAGDADGGRLRPGAPALAQSAPAAPPAPAASPAPAPSREALQQQLDAQNAKNEQLRQRIAKLEEVLKTDVCNNPEAEACSRPNSRPHRAERTGYRPPVAALYSWSRFCCSWLSSASLARFCCST